MNNQIKSTAAQTQHVPRTTRKRQQGAEHSAQTFRPVVVEVLMPHTAQWGHDPLQRLTYRGDARLRPGDQVVCPPTRLSRGWMRGVVVEIGDGGYTGETRVVTPIGRAKARIQREGSRA